MTPTLPCCSMAAIADRLAGRYAAGVESFGKMLVFAGLLVTVFGGVLWLGADKNRGGLLPGDLSVERGNFKVYFPIVTCLVVSILLTVLVRLFRR